MNCYLCDKDIGYLYKDRLYCNNHPVSVLHTYGALTKELVHVIFYTTNKDDTYQIILNPRAERSEINKVTIFRSDLGNSFEIPTLVQKFEYIISITPENAADKIKTIITFS